MNVFRVIISSAITAVLGVLIYVVIMKLVASGVSTNDLIRSSVLVGSGSFVVAVAITAMFAAVAARRSA